MGLEINRTLCVGGITSNIYSPRYVSFGQSPSDTFENTSLDRFTNEYAIKVSNF